MGEVFSCRVTNGGGVGVGVRGGVCEGGWEVISTSSGDIEIRYYVHNKARLLRHS